MTLWIRSQDKMELRPNPKLAIEVLQGKYYISDRYEFDKSNILGLYKTKERALEVLDEIQSKLDVFNKFINEPKDMFKNFFVPPIFVYEMPEN